MPAPIRRAAPCTWEDVVCPDDLKWPPEVNPAHPARQLVFLMPNGRTAEALPPPHAPGCCHVRKGPRRRRPSIVHRRGRQPTLDVRMND